MIYRFVTKTRQHLIKAFNKCRLSRAWHKPCWLMNISSCELKTFLYSHKSLVID